MRKVWKMEYGGWKMAGGRWLIARLKGFKNHIQPIANSQIPYSKLGIKCVQPCVNIGVQAVSVCTHYPQATEQVIFRTASYTQYPQAIWRLVHRVTTRLSTAEFRSLTDLEADLTTVST